MYVCVCVCRYRLSSGSSSPGEGDQYDIREAAIFTEPASKEPVGTASQERMSQVHKSPTITKEDHGSGGVAGIDGGGASLEDIYGASTDEDSDSDGEFIANSVGLMCVCMCVCVHQWVWLWMKRHGCQISSKHFIM